LGILELGSEIDHAIPLFAGGADTLNNMRVLCASCHALKTASERYVGGAVDEVVLFQGRAERKLREELAAVQAAAAPHAGDLVRGAMDVYKMPRCVPISTCTSSEMIVPHSAMCLTCARIFSLYFPHTCAARAAHTALTALTAHCSNAK
jgi:hypothetical protein